MGYLVAAYAITAAVLVTYALRLRAARAALQRRAEGRS